MRTDLRRPCTPSRGPASAVLAHPFGWARSGPRRRTTIWGTWPPNASPPFGITHLVSAVGEQVGTAGCRDRLRHGEQRLERAASRGQPVVVAEEEARGVRRRGVVERAGCAQSGLTARGPARR